MSKSKPKTSEPPVAGSEDHSVLDFLYNDSRRIGSFLSQFEVGHLQQITQTKEAERGKTASTETGAKGGLPGFAGGAYKQNQQTSLSAAEGSSRVYDPLWSNARAFLDHLSERDLIQRDLSAATFGQFVLAKGTLSVLDLASWKDTWALPAIQSKIREGVEEETPEPVGNRQQRKAAQGRAQSRKPVSDMDIVLEMLPGMPHSVQGHIRGPGGSVWFTLNEEFMAATGGELVLRAGTTLPGEWHILGILDGQPDTTTFEGLAAMGADDLFPPGISDSVIGNVVSQFAPLFRFMLGRPASSYGVTPLLIFREVS